MNMMTMTNDLGKVNLYVVHGMDDPKVVENDLNQILYLCKGPEDNGAVKEEANDCAALRVNIECEREGGIEVETKGEGEVKREGGLEVEVHSKGGVEVKSEGAVEVKSEGGVKVKSEEEVQLDSEDKAEMDHLSGDEYVEEGQEFGIGLEDNGQQYRGEGSDNEAKQHSRVC
ncbi:hypothetical protein LR48_Vigan252s000300 [Vigna angularis]|uniref:Uncharacterized protein n=1 Tax=Phaseolus angularis TaxID=3914 RepID=A0A0L9T7E7_PHAAN|nr:hypothetical protein LR48_Vigan252s000300 [Vigna angularis]